MSATSLPFHVLVAVLDRFLQQRHDIVQRLDALLNCQKRPLAYQQDAALQTRLVKDCFFTPATLTAGQLQVAEYLEQARRADGFTPRAQPGNDIVDAAQMLLRALHLWRQTRWPGQKGRLRYAHTLFNLQLLRCMSLLMLRVWDADTEEPAPRIAQLQTLLDRLWQGSPADQPQLVRDVRWLLPVALSPTTDSLAGYFEVAAKVASRCTVADRVAIQRAWVQTGAGHLCSQLRHLSVQKGVTLDDHALLLLTRRSNALDVALLLEGLVTLLDAYERSLASGNTDERSTLAYAICHGLTPDPELFVERLDLLGPYSMIETVFIGDADTTPCYTAAGVRHLQLIDEYRARLPRLAAPLLDDLRSSRAAQHAYSPYGALYGFSSNLLELMAFKTLQLDTELRFSLEDVFSPGDAARRAWVNDWRRLPHIAPEVVQQYAYAQDFVDALEQRVERALQRCVDAEQSRQHMAPGRLLLVTAASSAAGSQQVPELPELPPRYILASDAALARVHKATAIDAQDLQHCRMEGEYLLSYATPEGWVALDKDLLTDVAGSGHDTQVSGLPVAAAAVLCLMCPGIAVQLT